MDPANYPKLPQERDCSSPLGVFEKFRLESPVNSSDDSDVQFVSELELPRITRQNKHFTDTSISQDLDTASLVDGSTVEKKHCLFDTNIVTTIKKRQEGQSIRLLSSWNVDCKETQILDELEITGNQPEQSSKEVYDVDDDDNDESNPIIHEVDGEISGPCCAVLANEKYGREDQQGSAKAFSSKIYKRKRAPKKKPYGKEKTSGSHKQASAVSKQIRANTVQAPSDVLLMRDDLDVQPQEIPAAIWKGFIQMFSIKTFKVTAFQVSGYSTRLCQELPDVITSSGFICPKSVWEFVELIWPASTKDMCMLRLCPMTASDAVSYRRLFSYLNRKMRYGIIGTQKMESFIIPLPACQPIPSKLRPLGGPGLEDDHPHLLLALLLPNYQSWTSVPKKASPIHKEFDIPGDISSILDDMEKERQMGEHVLPCADVPSIEQSSQIGEVGMQELIGIFSNSSNNLQDMAVEAQNSNLNNNLPDQPNYTPEMIHFWPTYNVAPNIQPLNTFDGNPPMMFDPFAVYDPTNLWPFRH